MFAGASIIGDRWSGRGLGVSGRRGTSRGHVYGTGLGAYHYRDLWCSVPRALAWGV